MRRAAARTRDLMAKPVLSWARLSTLVTAGAECAYCGSREGLVAHHKVPRRLGGPDAIENLEPVCRVCHPRIEQDAAAEAKLVWERPERIEPDLPRRRAPRPPRLY